MPTTTNFKRGSIVLLPFPFSDLSGFKLRPAIVVSPPYPSEDLLVVAITSVGEILLPGEFAIREWRQAGLLHPSFAKRALASVSMDSVRKILGRLPEDDLAQLNEALSLWLGLRTAKTG
jgi:mRNA interferase MazF